MKHEPVTISEPEQCLPRCIRDGKILPEIEVIQAFVRGERAEIPTLISDGKRLYSPETVIAEWEEDKISIVPQSWGSAWENRAEILGTVVRLQIHKEKILRSLIRLKSEEAFSLDLQTWHRGAAGVSSR